MYRENMELNDKVAVLSEGIQYYKTIEKTLQKALVLAEKTAEDTKIAALEKAKAIEKEANTRSQLIVADAKNELEHIHNQTIQLIQQYEKYKCQFKNLAKVQMELIESECFNINLARLDAFIDTNSSQNNQQTTQQANSLSSNKLNSKLENKKDKSSKPVEEVNDDEANQQEGLSIRIEDSFFEALDQVSATSDYDKNYNEVKGYPKEEDDDYPYNQQKFDSSTDTEGQEEFSFINLMDDED